VEVSLSEQQLHALEIAWTQLNCDWDLDCLTNELLVACHPLFAQHRRQMTPQFIEQQREEMWEQYLELCELMSWDRDEQQSWFEQQLEGPIPFRDLLGYRNIYPGRFFDREAIGVKKCDATYSEIADSIQGLVTAGLARAVGKLGFVLTPAGIAIAREQFPHIQPHKRGNPLQTIDTDELEAIVAERDSLAEVLALSEKLETRNLQAAG
jgi:hypothetical protein